MTEPVRVADLCSLPGVVALEGDGDVRVTGVQSDSRRVRRGDLFAAVPGGAHDGARFVPDALGRGAVAVLAERSLSLAVPLLRCDRVRDCLGPLAHRVYGEPSHGFPVIGITGTNGKTTVAHLVEAVLRDAWGQVAMSGTIAMRGVSGAPVAGLTTPEADALARFARSERDAGARALVMEASSIALAQGRLEGMGFAVVAYTNLSQDHLDFHGSMEAYGAEKARLFEAERASLRVVCLDDAFGQGLAETAPGPLLRVSTAERDDADLCAVQWSSGRDGLRAILATPVGEVTLTSPLIGRHNLQNLIVTLGVAHALGLDLHASAASLATAAGAPGRLERVADPRGVAVFVDYAHTPDAVARALEALRPITPGRLIVVVGCGGDRDPKKRAPMGRAAVDGADVAVLTSDNPRTESPEAILDALQEGAEASGAERHGLSDLSGVEAGYCREVDRRRAIDGVLRAARAGDTVLIAGKGHEDYQIIGTEKRPFDDREVARGVIETLGEG